MLIYKPELTGKQKNIPDYVPKYKVANFPQKKVLLMRLQVLSPVGAYLAHINLVPRQVLNCSFILCPWLLLKNH